MFVCVRRFTFHSFFGILNGLFSQLRGRLQPRWMRFGCRRYLADAWRFGRAKLLGRCREGLWVCLSIVYVKKSMKLQFIIIFAPPIAFFGASLHLSRRTDRIHFNRVLARGFLLRSGTGTQVMVKSTKLGAPTNAIVGTKNDWCPPWAAKRRPHATREAFKGARHTASWCEGGRWHRGSLWFFPRLYMYMWWSNNTWKVELRTWFGDRPRWLQYFSTVLQLHREWLT